MATDAGDAGAAGAAGQAHDRTLTEILGQLADEGWVGDFMAIEGGELRCLTCREVIGADALGADRASRVEGASDPADMAIVVPVTCTACGAKGSIVAQFGPEASEADADLVVAMDRDAPSVPEEHRGG